MDKKRVVCSVVVLKSGLFQIQKLSVQSGGITHCESSHTGDSQSVGISIMAA